MKRNKRHKPGCTGKVKHPSRQVARMALVNMNNRQMEVYQCRRCGGWHIGRTMRLIGERIDQLLAGPAPRLKTRKKGKP